ncbi:MAG: hypothetical protein ABI881_08815 [Betaproteobacteria bacterium]
MTYRKVGLHVSRRRFLKTGARLATLGALPVATLGQPLRPVRAASSADAMPDAKNLLDRPSFSINLGPFVVPEKVYHGNSILDYSGSIYCPARRAILIFGGGHAATPADVVLAYPLSRLIDGSGPEMKWQADYEPTPLATMAMVESITVDIPRFDANVPRAEIELQSFLGPVGTMLRLGKVSIVDAGGQPVTEFETFYWKKRRGLLFPKGTAAMQPFKVTFQFAKYLTTGGFWKVDRQVPAIRPVSRHTYEATIWSGAANRMLLLCGNNGASYFLPTAVADAATGGNCAVYDPATRQWSDTGVPGLGNQAVEDPVSGNVLTFSVGTYAVFDPRSNTVLRSGNIGQEIGFFSETYVYYPPDDRFYLLWGGTRDGPQKALEISIDRNTWRLSLQPINDVNFRPRAKNETTYRYDPASQLIVGSIQQERNGKTYAYGFKPLGRGRGQWLAQAVDGGGAGTQKHHAVYIPELRAHAFLSTVEKRTDLVLWRPDPKGWSAPADDSSPKAAISVGGRVVQSLQQACDIGGDITVGEGTISGQGAKITKAVRITGAGKDRTIIDGEGIAIEGKGVFDCWADASFKDLAVVNAAGDSGNIAAIRHEAGKLLLQRVVLRHCQNGVLGGKPSEATVEMDDCDVSDCGIDESGSTHGVYFSAIAKATVNNCRFDKIHIGHYIKSRARENQITRNILGVTFDDTKSFNIDICYGGKAIIKDNVLRQGANADNNRMISYGAEARFIAGTPLAERIGAAGHVADIAHNRFLSKSGGVGIHDAMPETATAVRVDVHGNQFHGLDAVSEGTRVHSSDNAVDSTVPLSLPSRFGKTA